jgi:predicted acyl esterase
VTADPLFTSELIGIDIHHDVMVPMRDGTPLATDLYLPGSAPRPALLLLRSIRFVAGGDITTAPGRTSVTGAL